MGCYLREGKVEAFIAPPLFLTRGRLRQGHGGTRLAEGGRDGRTPAPVALPCPRPPSLSFFIASAVSSASPPFATGVSLHRFPSPLRFRRPRSTRGLPEGPALPLPWPRVDPQHRRCGGTARSGACCCSVTVTSGLCIPFL